MKFLMVSDLHLTDKPKDVYRWKLFPWLVKTINAKQLKYLFILGDLTDAKDFHSSVLVNKVVDALLLLLGQTELETIYILRGNHDGIDPTLPYFKFLNAIPQIKLIIKPNSPKLEDVRFAMLPHTKTPLEDWTPLLNQITKCDVVMMHATLGGAVSESGHTLSGMHSSDVEALVDTARTRIYSGDVHVPQRLGAICYVGAPYPIRFGDNFKPRALLVEYDKRVTETSLIIPNLRRVYAVIKHADELAAHELRVGDQLKVGLKLTQAEYIEWKERKEQIIKWCAVQGVDLCKLSLITDAGKIAKRGLKVRTHTHASTADILTEYCTQQKLDEQFTETGKFLLEETR